MEFNYLRHFQRRDLIGPPKSWRREQTPYRALTRPFSLSEAEYAEVGVACETILRVCGRINRDAVLHVYCSWRNVVFMKSASLMDER